MINAVANINGIVEEIETAFDNTLSRDGSAPNQMNAQLDMNSNRILNLPAPVDPNDPITLAYFRATVQSEDAADAAARAAASATQAAASATQALDYKDQAHTSQVNAEAAEQGANDALAATEVAAQQAADLITEAIAAQAIAQTSKGLFPSTAAAMGLGVIGHGSITGGSGGTNGTFDLAFTGGTGSGAAGRFVVSGGALVSIFITAPGSYTAAPTFSFAASSGLTGASAACILGTNVNVGEYFYKPSDDVAEGVILYRVDAGPTATEVKRFLTGLDADRVVREVVDVGLSDLSTETYGTVTPATASAATTNFWIVAKAVKRRCYVKTASIRVDTTGTGSFFIIDSSGQLLSEHPVTVSGTGVQTFTLSRALMPAGSRLGWKPSSGANARFESTGYTAHIPAAEYPSIGSRATVRFLVGSTVAIEFTVDYAPEEGLSTVSFNASRKVKDLASKFSSTISTAQPSTFKWPVGAPAMSTTAIGNDTGQDFPEGSLITGIVAELIATTSIDLFLVEIYSRPTSSGSIESAPVVSGDVLLYSKTFTPAEAGLTPGATEAAQVSIDVPAIPTEAGKSYFLVLSSWDSTGKATNFGLGGIQTTESRQRRRGFYKSTGAYVSIVSGFTTTLGFKVQGAKPAVESLTPVYDRLDEAHSAYTGFTLKTNAVVNRSGKGFCIGDSRDLTQPATGKIRYDTVYYDPEARAYGVANGGESIGGACERLPTLSSSKHLPLFNVRVTDTAITDVVPVWRVNRNGDPADIAGWLEDERKRSQSCIKKTLAKIRRGAPVKVGVIGDSIAAVQFGTIAEDIDAPNGPSRDRGAEGYLNGGFIDDDLLAAIPLYTSVGLGVGRSDDGAGAVHTKISPVWGFIETAKTLSGASVGFDNFAIGGKATANAVSGSSAGTWVTNAIALGWDLVFIHFGMNERGNTSTEANLIIIANAFKAAGIEVVMFGVPRIHAMTPALRIPWEYTNRAIARAALYTDSGHVPTGVLGDDNYLGALGISALDLCSANQNNHPGIRELNFYSREAAKLLL